MCVKGKLYRIYQTREIETGVIIMGFRPSVWRDENFGFRFCLFRRPDVLIDLSLHSAQFALEGLNVFLPIQNRTLQCTDGLLIDAAAFGCPRLAQLLFGIGQSRAFIG